MTRSTWNVTARIVVVACTFVASLPVATQAADSPGASAAQWAYDNYQRVLDQLLEFQAAGLADRMVNGLRWRISIRIVDGGTCRYEVLILEVMRDGSARALRRALPGISIHGRLQELKVQHPDLDVSAAVAALKSTVEVTVSEPARCKHLAMLVDRAPKLQVPVIPEHLRGEFLDGASCFYRVEDVGGFRQEGMLYGLGETRSKEALVAWVEQLSSTMVRCSGE